MWRYLIGFVATIVVLVLALAITLLFRHQRTVASTNQAQQVLAPFYALPAGWQSGWLAGGQQWPGLRARAAGTLSSAGGT